MFRRRYHIHVLNSRDFQIENGYFFLECSEEEAPKKANWVAAIKWKLIFSNEDLKKTLFSHLDRARSSLSSSGLRNVDNYRLLLSLLNHFKEEAA